MTKYETVANSIAKRIRNNEFAQTKKIPTEDQLIKEYDVSKNTIRNAIKLLVKDGLLYPVQGSGMLIREMPKRDTVFIGSTRGITSDHQDNKIETKCLSLEIIKADEQLAEKMRCKVDTPIYYLERLRYMDGIPYALEYTYYNKNIIHYLNKDIAESSIYNYIKNDLMLSFGFADKYINSRKLTKKESELLNLEENDPAIIIKDTVYLSNGTLFNSSQIIYNYKLANFFLKVES